MVVRSCVYSIVLRGYTQDLVVVPGYSEALLVSFNGDNAGPYDKNHINNLFKKVQSWFPGMLSLL